MSSIVAFLSTSLICNACKTYELCSKPMQLPSRARAQCIGAAAFHVQCASAAGRVDHVAAARHAARSTRTRLHHCRCAVHPQWMHFVEHLCICVWFVCCSWYGCLLVCNCIKLHCCQALLQPWLSVCTPTQTLHGQSHMSIDHRCQRVCRQQRVLVKRLY